MADRERIKKLVDRLRSRKDAKDIVDKARKPLFDKEKVANRIPADGGFPGGTSGVVDAVRHYFANGDDYVGDRIRDVMDAAARGDIPPENLSQVLAHEDAKRIYLGMPQEYGSFEPSPYRPTVGVMENPYQLNGLLTDESFDNTILPMYATWKTGQDWPLYDTASRVEDLGRSAQLSDFPYLHKAGMSEGFDDKGQYVSLHDVWDYNTSVKGKEGDNVARWVGGKPFDIYQRYYLDDWLDVPEEARGNPYVAPAYVESDYTGTRDLNEFRCGGKKFDEGGDKGAVRDNTRVSSLVPSDLGYVPAMERPVPASLGNARWDDGVVGALPLVGDALQGVQAIREFADRDPVSGLQTAGLVLVPNVAEKALRGFFRKASALDVPHADPVENFEWVDDKRFRITPEDRARYAGMTNSEMVSRISQEIEDARRLLKGKEPIHGVLSPEELGDELPVPQDVREDLWHSTLPRMRDMRTGLTNDETRSFYTRFKQIVNGGKYREVPVETRIKAGISSGTVGQHSPSSGGIWVAKELPEGTKQKVISHEFRHKLDRAFGLTDEERRILEEAYPESFIDANSDLSRHLAEKERVTTNRDARAVLLGDRKGLSVDEQNAIIDAAEPIEIARAVGAANGYGWNFIQKLINDNGGAGYTTGAMNKIREAMKKVGAVAGVGYLGKSLYDMSGEQDAPRGFGVLRPGEYANGGHLFDGGGKFFVAPPTAVEENPNPYRIDTLFDANNIIDTMGRLRVPVTDLKADVKPLDLDTTPEYYDMAPLLYDVPSGIYPPIFVPGATVASVPSSSSGDLFSPEAKARRRIKQRYAESRYDDNAGSNAGAKGPWQIMDITVKDYIQNGGKPGNIYDPEYNGGIRDWFFSVLPQRLGKYWSENDSDINKLAKLYAAYNWGAGNLKKFLQSRLDAGLSNDDPYEWVEAIQNRGKWKDETKNYVKFLALDQDIPGSYLMNEKFENAARRHGYMAEGGKIHIKPEIFNGKVYYRNGGILEGDFDVDDISDEELYELDRLGYDVDIL